jgi:hypothetical protein
VKKHWRATPVAIAAPPALFVRFGGDACTGKFEGGARF